MAGIGQLLKALALVVPLPVLAGVAVVGALWLAPAWVDSMHQRQLRGWVRRLIRADDAERARLAREIERRAGDKATRWAAVAHAADHYAQHALRDRAIERLRALGATADLRRWEKPPANKGPRDPLEALVRIEALYENGRTDAADEQLAEAIGRFPTDPDLAALAERRRAFGQAVSD